MSDTVTVTKGAFYTICLALLLFAVSSIFSIYWWHNQTSVSEDIPTLEPEKDSILILNRNPAPLFDVDKFKKFLIDGKYNSLMLIDKDGRIKWVSAEDGSEVKICGKIEGTRVTGCGLEKKRFALKTFTQITIASIEASSCTMGIFGGDFGLVHKGDDGMPYGLSPCHDAPIEDH